MNADVTFSLESFEAVSKSTITYKRRQQLLREVEGYLDLLTVLSDRWPPDAKVRDNLVRRAIATLDRAERNDAPAVIVAHMRGELFRVAECYQDAIEPLEFAAEQEPENSHIQLALGWCYKRVGRLDLAIQALEDALATDPDQGIIYYNLACYWSLVGNVAIALQYLTQAFELEPGYREQVAEEPDFDPIRNDPDFLMLTSVIV